MLVVLLVATVADLFCAVDRPKLSRLLMGSCDYHEVTSGDAKDAFVERLSVVLFILEHVERRQVVAYPFVIRLDRDRRVEQKLMNLRRRREGLGVDTIKQRSLGAAVPSTYESLVARIPDGEGEVAQKASHAF